MTHPSFVTVMLDEEYGYREWIWNTGMTASELDAWWSSRDTLRPYFFSPTGLPGELIQVGEDLSELDAKALSLMERVDKGEVTKEAAEKTIKEWYEKHPYKMICIETGDAAPERQPDWWSGHIHMEDDSYLKTSNGEVIHHAGFKDEDAIA